MPGRRAALSALAFTPLAALAACVVEPGVPPNPYPPVPAARTEVIPPPPGPATVWAWEPGHWHWNGGRYAWIGGHYVRREAHWERWNPGHWAYRDGAWRWVPGRWV